MGYPSRGEDALEYAAERNVPVTATAKIYSRDRNIWHMSHEGGILEDPANAAPEHIWMLSKSPADAPSKPVDVTIGFKNGAPVSLNGQHKLSGVALLEELNKIGGEQALGDRDWANILAGQSWAAATPKRGDRLASDYPDAGAYVLDLRLHPAELIRWREAGSAAARRLRESCRAGEPSGQPGLGLRRSGPAAEGHRAPRAGAGDRPRDRRPPGEG